MFHDWFELIGRDGKIEKPVAACAAFGVDFIQALRQTLVAGFIAEVALMIVNRLRESIPDFVANRLARKFSRRFLEFLSKVAVGFFAPGEADDGNSGRQIAVGREIIKSGNEFAMGIASDQNRKAFEDKLRAFKSENPLSIGNDTISLHIAHYQKTPLKVEMMDF